MATILTLILWLVAGIVLAIAWSIAHAEKGPIANCDYKCENCAETCEYRYTAK